IAVCEIDHYISLQFRQQAWFQRWTQISAASSLDIFKACPIAIDSMDLTIAFHYLHDVGAVDSIQLGGDIVQLGHRQAARCVDGGHYGSPARAPALARNYAQQLREAPVGVGVDRTGL